MDKIKILLNGVTLVEIAIDILSKKNGVVFLLLANLLDLHL